MQLVYNFICNLFQPGLLLFHQLWHFQNEIIFSEGESQKNHLTMTTPRRK